MNIIDLQIKLNIIEQFILRITYRWTADVKFMTITKSDGTILKLINNRGKKIFEINQEDNEYDLRRKIDICEERFSLFNDPSHPDIYLLTITGIDGNITELVNRIPEEVEEEVEESEEEVEESEESEESEEETEEESEEGIFQVDELLENWEIA